MHSKKLKYFAVPKSFFCTTFSYVIVKYTVKTPEFFGAFTLQGSLRPPGDFRLAFCMMQRL